MLTYLQIRTKTFLLTDQPDHVFALQMPYLPSKAVSNECLIQHHMSEK